MAIYSGVDNNFEVSETVSNQFYGHYNCLISQPIQNLNHVQIVTPLVCGSIFDRMLLPSVDAADD